MCLFYQNSTHSFIKKMSTLYHSQMIVTHTHTGTFRNKLALIANLFKNDDKYFVSKIIIDKEEEEEEEEDYQDTKETQHDVDMVDFHAYSNFELYVECCWRENQ